jgi:hypothetical protein
MPPDTDGEAAQAHALHVAYGWTSRFLPPRGPQARLPSAKALLPAGPSRPAGSTSWDYLQRQYSWSA